MISDALVEKVAARSEIVRLAFRTFIAATEKGYDTGEAISEAVTAILPSIEAEVREEDAKIADEWTSTDYPSINATAKTIAAAIRARIGAAG